MLTIILRVVLKYSAKPPLSVTSLGHSKNDFDEINALAWRNKRFCDGAYRKTAKKEQKIHSHERLALNRENKKNILKSDLPTVLNKRHQRPF